jgi:hypothetical protein
VVTRGSAKINRLVNAAWEIKQFREYLCGSVVLYFHIRDMKTGISKAARQVAVLEKVSILMQQVLQLERKLESQLKLLRQVKRGLLREAVWYCNFKFLYLISRIFLGNKI